MTIRASAGQNFKPERFPWPMTRAHDSARRPNGAQAQAIKLLRVKSGVKSGTSADQSTPLGTAGQTRSDSVCNKPSALFSAQPYLEAQWSSATGSLNTLELLANAIARTRAMLLDVEVHTVGMERV
jgi:hypothetical protein